MARPTKEHADKKLEAIKGMLKYDMSASQMARLVGISPQAMRGFLRRHNLMAPRDPNPAAIGKINVDNIISMHESGEHRPDA